MGVRRKLEVSNKNKQIKGFVILGVRRKPEVSNLFEKVRGFVMLGVRRKLEVLKIIKKVKGFVILGVRRKLEASKKKQIKGFSFWVSDGSLKFPEKHFLRFRHFGCPTEAWSSEISLLETTGKKKEEEELFYSPPGNLQYLLLFLHRG